MKSKKKRIMFVLNPYSGKAKIKWELMGIIDQMNKAGCEVSVWISQEPKQIVELVKAHAAEYDQVVCSGGDGTLNETISAIMELENPPVLGYIPAGSTNDVAVGLGIPGDMQKAAEIALHGQEEVIDIGGFNQKYFTYVACFGAFTEVTYMTPQELKNLLGHQAYVLSAVKYLSSIKPIRLKVTTAEGDTEEMEVLFGMISNAKSIAGSKFLVAKHVDLADGLFECFFIKNPKNPLPDFAAIVGEAIAGNLQNEQYFYNAKSSEFHIEMEEETGWVLDGEFGGIEKNIHIRTYEKAVRIRIPEETDKKAEK